MVSLTCNGMRVSMYVAAIVTIAATVLAISAKRGNDASNGKASSQNRTQSFATITSCKNVDAFATGYPWVDADVQEVLKLPPREPLDAVALGRLVQTQIEIVQAYSNNDASVLRELKETLPASVERIPTAQFQGSMLGFVYLVLGDVQLADLHPQHMAFSDAESLSRFLEARLAALLLVGDMLIRRKDFDPMLAALEGHALGALRNLEHQFASAGRVDMVESVLEYRRKVIDHVESDEGYLRAYTVVAIAQMRLHKDLVDSMGSYLVGNAAFMEDRAQYRPKWLDDLIEVVEAQQAKARSTQ